MLKKVLFTVFSLFLVYRTIDLMKFLLLGEIKTSNHLESFTISFLLALFVTGVFAFLGFSFKTNKLLPEGYYAIKNPRVLSQTYDLLGVKYFRRFLLFTFWGHKKNKAKYFNGTRAGFENLIHQTKQSEFGHLGAFVALLILSILLVFRGYTLLFALITIINIIGNFYPIILQRKHRLRIAKIMKIKAT